MVLYNYKKSAVDSDMVDDYLKVSSVGTHAYKSVCDSMQLRYVKYAGRPLKPASPLKNTFKI